MKARVIITFDCPRQCVYCCNKYTHIIKGATKVPTIKEVIDEKPTEVMLTGGEPMLNAEITYHIARYIHTRNIPVYLYTAYFDQQSDVQKLKSILNVVDGIHYTLHAATNYNDIQDFYAFQNLINQRKYANKSFRLFVHSEVKYPIEIYPWLYKRIESKQWIDEKACQLPKDETLFILGDEPIPWKKLARRRPITNMEDLYEK